MSQSYGGKGRNEKKRFIGGAGLSSVPEGAQLISLATKAQYETNPFHVYHPTPHDAVTILRDKKSPHEWLVCGWYLDTLRDGRGVVTGLVYKRVAEEADREAVLAELKKHDKEATVKFVA